MVARQDGSADARRFLVRCARYEAKLEDSAEQGLSARRIGITAHGIVSDALSRACETVQVGDGFTRQNQYASLVRPA